MFFLRSAFMKRTMFVQTCNVFQYSEGCRIIFRFCEKLAMNNCRCVSLTNVHLKLNNPKKSSRKLQADVINDHSSYKPLLDALEEFGFSADTAVKFVTQLGVFQESDVLSFNQKLQFLRNCGVSADLLLKHPSLCWKDREVDVFSTVLDMDTEAVSPLMEISNDLCQYVKGRYDEDIRYLKCNRFHFFSSYFSMSLLESSVWVASKSPILHIPSLRIKQNIALARKLSIPLETLKKNARLFLYSSSYIRRQVSKIRLQGTEDIRAWMLSTDNTSISSFNRNLWAEEVAHVLRCDKDYVTSWCVRWPGFLSVKISKMEEICTTLERKGISRNIVTRSPLVLRLSPSKVEEKIDLLLQAGLTTTEIESNHNVLIQNTQRFNLFLNLRLKGKKKAQ